MFRAGYSVAAFVADREELTAQQKGALAERIAELRNEEGLPAKAAYLALHRGRYADNPLPQGSVPRTEWAPDELKNLLLQRTVGGVPVWLAIRSLESHQNPQVAALAKLIPEVFTLKAVNLQNPLVAQALQTLKQVGVLSDQLHQEIATMPDPDWRPVVWEPPLVQTVCGPDAVLEWSEFMELWEAAGE
ncbi:MAG: hypothetical protein N2109_12700 [Fimbriimonadales bacterium]|nr:hypothetical protein [Fimbriimonadales bacterium]